MNFTKVLFIMIICVAAVLAIPSGALAATQPVSGGIFCSKVANPLCLPRRNAIGMTRGTVNHSGRTARLVNTRMVFPSRTKHRTRLSVSVEVGCFDRANRMVTMAKKSFHRNIALKKGRNVVTIPAAATLVRCPVGTTAFSSRSGARHGAADIFLAKNARSMLYHGPMG